MLDTDLGADEIRAGVQGDPEFGAAEPAVLDTDLSADEIRAGIEGGPQVPEWINPLDGVRDEYGEDAVRIIEELSETLDMSPEDVLLTIDEQPDLLTQQAKLMLSRGDISDPDIQAFVDRADEVLEETGEILTMARYQEILEQEAAAATQFTQTFKLPERNADNFKI